MILRVRQPLHGGRFVLCGADHFDLREIYEHGNQTFPDQWAVFNEIGLEGRHESVDRDAGVVAQDSSKYVRVLCNAVLAGSAPHRGTSPTS